LVRKLIAERRATILTALVEGNSIAATCRMFGVSKITVLRLLADAGSLALQFHDLIVCDLATKRVQMDEIWSFCHSKERNVRRENWGKGMATFGRWVAIDADSKLAINWLIGGRDARNGRLFVADLASRLKDRVQLTSDGLVIYRDAVARAFGGDVDYGCSSKSTPPNAKATPATARRCASQPVRLS
jgi:hypothetical protein